METITGTQKTAHERLKQLLARIEDGGYGSGDDLDLSALRADLDDALFDLD
jgi:hypothetical protein